MEVIPIINNQLIICIVYKGKRMLAAARVTQSGDTSQNWSMVFCAVYSV